MSEEIIYSLESEQSALGAVLIEPKCFSVLVELLPSKEYFANSMNKLIYQAMRTLNDNGEPIDAVTVLNTLSRDLSQSDMQSYRSYLVHIGSLVPNVSNIESYCKTIREKHDIRMLLQASENILTRAKENKSDANLLLDYAEQVIFSIRQGKALEGLVNISEIILSTVDNIEKAAENDLAKNSVPTGISLLDYYIGGLNRSDLIVLAARPGMGKTSFALNIMRHAGVVNNKCCCFFSLEMTKEQLVSRLLSNEGSIPSKNMRNGKLTDDEWDNLLEATKTLSDTKLYFDDNSSVTVSDIKAKVRRLSNFEPVDLVIIDYLQLMQSSEKAENRVQEISKITRQLKIMAKELNVPVVILSQLSRATEQRGVSQRKPMLSDLRESGSIEQDADIVLFLYRQDYYNSTSGTVDENVNRNEGECIIAKNRHGETSSVPLSWIGEFMRFTAVDNRYDNEDPFA